VVTPVAIRVKGKKIEDKVNTVGRKEEHSELHIRYGLCSDHSILLIYCAWDLRAISTR
jgi:hypothetical protein